MTVGIRVLVRVRTGLGTWIVTADQESFKWKIRLFFVLAQQ